jgi:hypothetical protein
MGLQDKVNTTLITALQAMVNASNSAAVAALLNSQICNLNSAGGQNAAAAAMVRLCLIGVHAVDAASLDHLCAGCAVR